MSRRALCRISISPSLLPSSSAVMRTLDSPSMEKRERYQNQHSVIYTEPTTELSFRFRRFKSLTAANVRTGRRVWRRCRLREPQMGTDFSANRIIPSHSKYVWRLIDHFGLQSDLGCDGQQRHWKQHCPPGNIVSKALRARRTHWNEITADLAHRRYGRELLKYTTSSWTAVRKSGRIKLWKPILHSCNICRISILLLQTYTMSFLRTAFTLPSLCTDDRRFL